MNQQPANPSGPQDPAAASSGRPASHEPAGSDAPAPHAETRGPADDDSAADAEQQLALVLAELTDRAQRGQPVDIDQACRAYPELAEELRELWGMIVVAEAIGSASGEPTDPSSPAPHAAAISLPCRLGDYELIEEIGRGGMGIVYRAQQLSLNREVAVKMILGGPAASHEERERFLAEAQAVARLDHPGIVPVYEVNEWEGRPYFSMKYIRGQTLAERVADGPLSSRETARLMGQVARAVDYAHRHGILHRDLKPSNILIDEQGTPHVTDFGLAKRVPGGRTLPGSPGSEPTSAGAGAQQLTRTGAVVGTPAYMSPEQSAGNRGGIGPASDVYSLGSVIYFALTGRPPFRAETAVDVVLMVMEQEPTPPRVLNPAIDRDLELITLRCLQKPADLRYATAELLADDIEAYLNDEIISAREGLIYQVLSRVFRETHHAVVLENWGLLWMWHSLVLVVVCTLTNGLVWMGYEDRWHYVALWTVALWTWAGVFWALRRRMGPVMFVERQIAHVWAASMISIALLFPLEWWLDLPVLKLSPVLGLVNGMIFLVKAGILSGAFYVQAVALFATAGAMALWPQFAHLIFGAVSAASFFFPGLKYYRQAQAKRTQA